MDKKTIFVVDDNPAMLNVINFMLKTGGYTVITAFDGKMALNLLAKTQHKISLFVVDYDMPLVNGLELSTAIRQDEKYITTPIIMITGLNNLPAYVLNTELFNSIIYKPFEPGIFLDTIFNLLLEAN